MNFKDTEIGRIPFEWDVRMIQDVAEVVSGATPKTKVAEYWDGNIAWITPKDLSNHTERYIYRGDRMITDEGLKNSSAKLLPKGSVLFSSRAPIGYTAIAAQELCTNQGFKSMICNQQILDNNFMFYMMNYKKNEIENIAGGSTFKEVSGKTVKEFKIPIPPLDEQKAIAKVLSDLDEKIETNNKINKKLEEMAQAIFKQWFVDFEFPNEDGEPYKSSGGEMVESELGMIPKGWKVVKLGQLCDISTKSEKPFNNHNKIYEHFSLPACDNGKIPVIEYGKNISSNKYKIDNSCILISKLNPSTKRIWEPLCKTDNAICSTEFIVYKPKNTTEKSFLYEVINSDKFTEFLLANVTGSTGSRQRVKPQNTLDYKVILPDLDRIRSINNILKNIHEKVKLDIYENVLLKSCRDILLPKLMSGEIRVPLNNEH